MDPVEEKHTNDATSHILLFQRCNGAGSRREKLLLSQRNVVCSRLHIYQKKRPYLYSDNSGYTRELSAPCGVEQDISIDGKWESIERTCSTPEGEWIGSTMFSIMLPVWGCWGCCPLWLSIWMPVTEQVLLFLPHLASTSEEDDSLLLTDFDLENLMRVSFV